MVVDASEATKSMPMFFSDGVSLLSVEHRLLHASVKSRAKGKFLRICRCNNH